MISSTPAMAGSASTSTATQIPKRMLLIVATLVILIVTFGIVGFLTNAFNPSLNVTIGDKVPSVSGCGTNGGAPNYYTYGWTFILTNNGYANANAIVVVVPTSANYSGVTPLTTQVFTAPRESMVTGTLIYSPKALDCTPLSLDIEIQSIVASSH